MIIEMSDLQQKIDRQKKCVHFLFSYNDQPDICVEPVEENGIIIEGECLHAIKETLKWPTKLQTLISNADDRHTAQRTACELKTLASRHECDAQVTELAAKIKKTPTYQKINEFPRINGIVQEINTNLTAVRETAVNIMIAEKHLFETTTENQLLIAIIKQFEPCYEMWSTIN